jgi:hypothetical protein
MTRPASILALSGLLAAVLVGCADYGAGAEADEAPREADEWDPEQDLRIDVYPPATLPDGTSIDLLEQSFLGVSTQDGWSLDLPLQQAITVRGALTGFEVNETADVSVPGEETRVRGFFEARVPGTILARTTQTDADGEFRLDLVPSASYQLAWIPEDPSLLPFLVTTDEILEADTDLSVALDAGLALYGQVTSGDDGLAIAPGAVVQAVDAVTGIGGPLASVGPDGRYRLRVYPGDYELRIWKPDNAFFPSQSLPVTVAEAEGLEQDIFYDTLSMPTVFGEVRDADGSSRANVSVIIRSEELTGTPFGQVEVETNTDSNGLFQARLIPGSYTIEFVPDYDSPWGPTRVSRIEVGETGAEVPTVELQARPPVQGTVVSEGDGLPIAGVLVRAEELGYHGYVYETVSNDDGLFVLPVSDAELLWTLEPPRDSGLATTFLDRPAGQLLEDGQVALSVGQEVTGTVTWNGEPVPYATLDVRDAEDRLFGTATTDLDGGYVVRIDPDGVR